MICLLTFIVFGILGIFSASHREIAKEAFQCVFKRTTFRKCDSGTDIKVKGKIVGTLMKKSPKSAKIVHNHFEFISWIFTILFFVSLIYSGVSAYNLIVHDNCVGPDADPEQCIFTPSETVVDCGDPLCDNEGHCQECGDDCDCNDCES
jgi:Ni,Fe-hydrogenase I cytochrome b subunit